MPRLRAASLARAALAALALAGDRLAFGRASVWLRSGCDLAKVSETLGLERPGGEVDDLAVTAQDALDAFDELRERAAAAGIPMEKRHGRADRAVPDLAEAIRFAVTSGTQEDEA